VYVVSREPSIASNLVRQFDRAPNFQLAFDHVVMPVQDMGPTCLGEHNAPP
jgi:hypothetical protein